MNYFYVFPETVEHILVAAPKIRLMLFAYHFVGQSRTVAIELNF